MAYAVIRTGGKQFCVTEGQVVRVPSLGEDVGKVVEFDVMTVADGSNVHVGAPLLDQKVKATVVEHGREEKIIVFKFKRRKGYKKKQGHRQGYTAVRIDSIV